MGRYTVEYECAHRVGVWREDEENPGGFADPNMAVARAYRISMNRGGRPVRVMDTWTGEPYYV